MTARAFLFAKYPPGAWGWKTPTSDAERGRKE